MSLPPTPPQFLTTSISVQINLLILVRKKSRLLKVNNKNIGIQNKTNTSELDKTDKSKQKGASKEGTKPETPPNSYT